MTDLTHRPAATSVIEECLRLQSLAPRRGRLARSFGVRPLSADARPWFAGAIGELEVGRILAKLDPGWTVLHAVPSGTADTDIDHLVIGPGGIFTINTKHHADKNIWVSPKVLMVNGVKQDHLRNSRSEAKRATRAIGLPVTPIIALVAAKKLTIKEKPDVFVMHDHQLVRWLHRRPEIHSEKEVESIATFASDVRTWHPTHSGKHTPELAEQFGALRREDSAARVVRLAWGAFLAIAVGVSSYLAITKVGIPLLLSSF
jgi:hypothetical protein